MNKLLAPIALSLVVWGCSLPVGPHSGTRSPAAVTLAPGQAQLVLSTSAGRAALADAGFLTVELWNPATSVSLFSTAAKAGGTYSVIVDNITAGDWQLSARLYPDSEDPTLLFHAQQSLYIAPGSTYSVNLRVYEPGEIAGVTLGEAGLPFTLNVSNFHTDEPWTGPRSLSLGLPLRLVATLEDSDGYLTKDQRVEWVSSNPAVLVVNSKGRVSPLQEGTAILKATSLADRRLTASFNVTVEASVVGYWQAPDGSVVIIRPNASTGATYRISVVRSTPLAWETGALTTVAPGSYQILLNRQMVNGLLDDGPGYGGSLTDSLGTLSVTGANFGGAPVLLERIFDPKPVTSLSVDASNPLDLEVSVIPADATVPHVFWGSLAPATATIDPLTGVVTPVASGPVSFQASSLDNPVTMRQVWATSAHAWLPQVSLSGPTTVQANPLATFALTSNLPTPTRTQWVLDGTVVADRGDGSVAPLVFNTTNLAIGKHKLMVKVTSGGQVYDSVPWSFTVGQRSKVQVSSSGHTLFVKPDGSLWGWGPTLNGELGLGAATNHVHRPQFIDSNVAQVATGNQHSLYLKHDGTLWFMGRGYNTGTAGDGGDDNYDTPHQVASGNIQAIAAGDSQSWILKKDGTLWATGKNTQGTLGTGDNSDRTTFTQVLTEVAAVYPSLNGSTFALKTNGELWSTGRNDYGELGYGFASAGNSFFPTTLVGDSNVTGTILSVAPGYYYTVVVTSTGQVWTTGSDNFGQLGNGAGGDVLGFQLVTTIPGLVKAATSGASAMLLKNDGTVYASGRNYAGEFGDGTTNGRPTFSEVDVLRPAPVVDLFAAVVGFYYLLADGSFWGSGSPYTDNGPSMGLGNDIDQLVPVPIPLDPVPPKIFSNGNRTFALFSDGTLKATGNQNLGALGDGVVTDTNLDSWVTIAPFSVSTTFVSVALGNNHTLFLLSNGTVWAVGSNALGQLGDGTTTNRTTAYQVTNYTTVSQAKAIAAGGSFSMILQTNGQVVAFGSNSGGQLGLPLSTSYSPSPGTVSGVSGAAVAIAAGSDFGLILKADGTVYGAGVDSNNGHGQAGFSTTQQTPYAQVPGLSSILGIAAGPQFSFAIGLNNTLYAAGWNAAGQLGYNVDADFDTYFDDPEGFTQVWTKVKAVSAGAQHTLIHRTDGTLWGFGAALGSGSATNTAIPQFLGEALSLGAGGNNSFVVRPDGTLWWFGSHELSNGISGTQSATATPERVW